MNTRTQNLEHEIKSQRKFFLTKFTKEFKEKNRKREKSLFC